jgi:hypothetical protein
MPLTAMKSQRNSVFCHESNYARQHGIILKLFREGAMAKRAGAYRSEKRKKEVKRQKKQEEKRLRRLGLLKGPEGAENPEAGEQETPIEGEAGEGQEAGEEKDEEKDEEKTS